MTKVKVLASLTVFLFNIALAQAKSGDQFCEIQGIRFPSDPKTLLSSLNREHWEKDWPDKSKSILDQCAGDWKHNNQEKGPDFSFQFGTCYLRGSKTGLFSDLTVDWRLAVVSRVKLSYPERKGRIAADFRKEVIQLFGKPISERSYFEEAYRHELGLWKPNGCTLILDGADLSFFPAGYVPSPGDPLRTLFSPSKPSIPTLGVSVLRDRWSYDIHNSGLFPIHSLKIDIEGPYKAASPPTGWGLAKNRCDHVGWSANGPLPSSNDVIPMGGFLRLEILSESKTVKPVRYSMEMWDAKSGKSVIINGMVDAQAGQIEIPTVKIKIGVHDAPSRILRRNHN